MARFRFKLEPVLELRRREERERQRVVAMLEARRGELESRLRARQVEIAHGKADLRAALAPGAGAAGAVLRLQAASMIGVQAKAHVLVLRLAGVHEQLKIARAHLAEAARARRAVELLRERRYDQWKRDLQRAEANAIDEIASMRAARTGARSPFAPAGPRP